MKRKNHSLLTKFGFSFERGGVHIARTMMLSELRGLLSYVNKAEVGKNVYLSAINEDNCLGKRSVRTRLLTYRHLADLYSLDSADILFRTLLFFWNRDSSGQPLLASLCAYARDAVLRSTAQFILAQPTGTVVTRESLEHYIESREPGRFSAATLKSTAQNINSTWTQSGHLVGRVKKMRSSATPTAGSVSYALLLGYLSGFRGQSLFQTEYAKLLDCLFEQAIELAEEASRRGWIVFKRVGSVIEVLFPNLIRQEEMGWLCEQS